MSTTPRTTTPRPAPELAPGTVVSGPFWSHDDRAQGVGIITAPGRALWTRVPPPYVAVRVLVGDRIPGGYHPSSLTILTDLRPA